MSAPWEVRFTKQAKKDVKHLPPQLKAKFRAILLEVLARNPYEGKKLLGDLAGSYSYHTFTQNDLLPARDEQITGAG